MRPWLRRTPRPHRRPWSTRLRHSTVPPTASSGGGRRVPGRPWRRTPFTRIAGILVGRSRRRRSRVRPRVADRVPASGANRSRSITARSASLPISIEPVTSSRWLTSGRAEREPRDRRRSVIRSCREERLLVAARLRPDPLDGDLHLHRAGSAVETLQSEPIASRAPAAQERARTGTASVSRSGPRNGIVRIVHLGRRGRPRAAGRCRRRRARRSAGCRPGG